jgi:hypothetical protein
MGRGIHISSQLRRKESKRKEDGDAGQDIEKDIRDVVP